MPGNTCRAGPWISLPGNPKYPDLQGEGEADGRREQLKSKVPRAGDLCVRGSGCSRSQDSWSPFPAVTCICSQQGTRLGQLFPLQNQLSSDFPKALPFCTSLSWFPFLPSCGAPAAGGLWGAARAWGSPPSPPAQGLALTAKLCQPRSLGLPGLLCFTWGWRSSLGEGDREFLGLGECHGSRESRGGGVSPSTGREAGKERADPEALQRARPAR